MLAKIGEQLGVALELLIEPNTILGAQRGNRLLGRPRGIGHDTNRTVGSDRWGPIWHQGRAPAAGPLEIRV